MPEQISSLQLEEAIDPEDCVAIARLIAAYQSNRDDSARIVDTLCLHADIGFLWNVVFTTVCRSDADVERLTNLTTAIMDCAAESGASETFVWLDMHRTLLGWQSRTSYDGEMSASYADLSRITDKRSTQICSVMPTLLTCSMQEDGISWRS